MRQILAVFLVLALAGSCPMPARALSLPAPLADLQATLSRAANRAPGRVSMEVKDLKTGYISSVNANAAMPAASTIKIPIMVEVFHQLAGGYFDVNHRVTLMPSDRDWGSGEIADAPVGSTFPVSELLTQMIAVSDNTAANMLIRLVGRQNINDTMHKLGLRHTRIADYIRTAGWGIRLTLRSSAADMVHLLSDMAGKKLIDEWSSQQMITILERQEINSLIPVGLPEIPIAHKTGSLADTLNDVGIVYAADEPYIIAVMTTQLPTLSSGRRFIRGVSRIAYADLQNFAKWRAAYGLSAGCTNSSVVSAADSGTPNDGAAGPDNGGAGGYSSSGCSGTARSSDVPIWARQTPLPATPDPESTP